MAINWFWLKQIEVPCPDGTTQFVFKNVDHAFPFYFKQAKTSTSAALEGLKKIKGKVDAKYETEIKHLLISIDEKNSSIQAHLRAAYVLYMAAPCKKLDYLQSAIEAIRQDEKDLRAAELGIRKLVELLSSQSGHTLDQTLIATASEQLAHVFKTLNRHSSEAVLIEKMKHVAQISYEWRHP
jgi:MoxR-like ATPase